MDACGHCRTFSASERHSQTSVMSYPIPSIIAVEGRTIRVAHPTLPGGPKSFLSASVSALGTTLTLQDNSGFSNSEWIRLGKPGTERSEAVRINGAVTRGTSLTTTACVFDHPTGTEVEYIHMDQWRVYGNNSSSGAILLPNATINVRWDQEETRWTNTGTEYAYYLVVGYDSNAAAALDVYSDGVSRTAGWTENTVGALVESALKAAKAERGGRLDDSFFIREINDCARYITGKLKRFSFLQVFDYVVGTCLQGSYSFTLPSDIEDKNSNKSILGVRVGLKDNLTYQDKREWEKRLYNVAYTQVTTQATSGQTTLEIDNSYDFDDSGSVDIFVSGTKYTVTYTGVTRSATAGVLTGVPASGTGSISVTVTVDTHVWQDQTEGSPAYFTVYDGSVYTWPLADSSNDKTNLWLDYYSSRTAVNSYADTIDGQRYDLFKHFLVWKIRSLNNGDGELNLKDGDYLFFREILDDMIRREVSGQKGKWKYRTSSGQSVKIQIPSSN